MTVLAHVGHWYHSLLYAAPIILIALALWWSGRRADQAGSPKKGGGDGRGANDRAAGPGDEEPEPAQGRAAGD
jgi:hypothetical protein